MPREPVRLQSKHRKALPAGDLAHQIETVIRRELGSYIVVERGDSRQ